MPNNFIDDIQKTSYFDLFETSEYTYNTSEYTYNTPTPENFIDDNLTDIKNII